MLVVKGAPDVDCMKYWNLTYWGWEKWSPFCWRNTQMYFIKWKWFDWQWIRIGLDNGLAPKRRQAIIWNRDGLVYRNIYASLSFSEIKFTMQAFHFEYGIRSYSMDIVLLIEVEWLIHASVILPSLVKIMACCLVGAKPLSNQCWNIINRTRNKFQWNRNYNIFIQDNAFESVACEKVAISLGLNEVISNKRSEKIQVPNL